MIGQVHLFNLFTPLVVNGGAKKVIAISTGMADLDLTNKQGVYHAAPYAISKAALNMVVGKFNAEYRDRGVLFMSISPGLVNTGNAPIRKDLFFISSYLTANGEWKLEVV